MDEKQNIHPEVHCEITYQTSTGYKCVVTGRLLSINADRLTYLPGTDDEDALVIDMQKSTLIQIKYFYGQRTTGSPAA